MAPTVTVSLADYNDGIVKIVNGVFPAYCYQKQICGKISWQHPFMVHGRGHGRGVRGV